MLTPLTKHIDQLEDCIESVLESTEDPREANKKFQKRKKDLDAFVKETLVDGDPPLSGKFKDKPKVIKLVEGVPSLEVKIENFDCVALGISKIRIDSLSYAKKALTEFESIKPQIDRLMSILASKIEFVSSRISSIDFEKEAAKASVNVRDEYSSLKDLQERAARAKGRTYALLVNVKI